MLYFDAKSGETTYVNGSAARPLARIDGFTSADIAGGRGVAVPGFWAGFEAAHERHGKLSKRTIMGAAIDYARNGDRISAYVCPNIIFDANQPILASGSPSISLLQNIVQNTTNILDFGISIAESVNRPRFGAGSYANPGKILIEADMDKKVRDTAANRGIAWNIVNPWNWHRGSFEGIQLAKDGTAYACGDPRRNALALAA